MFFFPTDSVTDLAPNQLLVDLEKTLIQSATASTDCQPSNIQLPSVDSIESIAKSKSLNHKQIPTTNNYSPSCEILNTSLNSPSNVAVGDLNDKDIVLNDVRPFSALYDIICKEKQIENIMSSVQQTDQFAEKLSQTKMGLTDQNGSVDRRRYRSAAEKNDQISTTETEQQPLDRTIHNQQSTSQNNSKFTVAYMDRMASESIGENRQVGEITSGLQELDAR